MYFYIFNFNAKKDNVLPIIFRELLYGQDVFPVGNYASPAYLMLLRQLGLQTEDDITAQDLYNSATCVEQLYTQVRGGGQMIFIMGDKCSAIEMVV